MSNRTGNARLPNPSEEHPERFRPLWQAYRLDKSDGNRNAIFEAYWPEARLRAIGCAKGAGMAQYAEDIAQNAGARMLEVIPTFVQESDTAFGGFIHLCIMWEIGSYLRSRRSKPSVQLLDFINGEPNPNLFDDSLDGCVELEEREETDLLVGLLRRGLESLAERDRQILQSYFFDGLTMNEIVPLVGLSYSSVCKHIHKSLEKLRLFVDKNRNCNVSQ